MWEIQEILPCQNLGKFYYKNRRENKYLAIQSQ